MKKILLQVILSIIFPLLIIAQPSKFSKELYISDKGDTLPYRMLFPDYNTNRSFPLIIFLHGSGERGNDNEAQLKWGVMNFATDREMSLHPAFVIAPQCPSDQWWSNFDENRKSMNLILKAEPTRAMAMVNELISYMIKHYSIDKNRIYITGLSMGGYGTFDALSRYPDIFAAAIPVCGGGDVMQVEKFKHVPIWIFHGADDTVVPAEYSINMLQALNKAGARPGCTIFPESGHFSWLAAYSDPMLMDWMYRQYKK